MMRDNHDMARRPSRRGFNLLELLIALAISATLLTATMVALNASFMAYQTTTEVASTHTVSRLAMHRMLTLIRTGTEFEPRPITPAQSVIQSDYIDFRMPDGSVLALEWDAVDEALYVVVGGFGGTRYVLLEGVVQPLDPDGDPIPPFTLEYALGHELYRATIDLTIRPDDNQDVEIDGDNSASLIRLVASAMPRNTAFE